MSHPIVAQMRPSPEQQPAILARGRDVVVTAGAGTGKTRTLVARYLSLLAEGVPLRGIVAITFTIKAAREMRNRVRDEIRKYLERDDLTPGARERWQTLYAGLDAARISTIHSLCAEILRAHPAEAAVDPRFEMLDEGQQNILRGRALDDALAWAADDQALVVLFGLLGVQRLRGALGTLLGQRLDVAPCLDDLPDPLWPVWEASLAPPICAFVDDAAVQDAFARLVELRENGTLDRAEAAGDRLAGPLRRLLAIWDDITRARQAEDWAAVSVRLAPLRGEMALVGRADNWQPADPKAIIRELRECYETQLGAWVGKGINLELDRQLADAMPLLRRLFEGAVAVYDRLKAERHALDFDDLESRALALLEKNAAVRARWVREVAALLVDEFQDTNARQRDLVKLLNGDEGRLFIVGDAKQSIYRFRGADVTVFRAERESIERCGGAAFSLDTSYRAHEKLVQGLNHLLRRVLGEADDPQRPWAEPFAPLLHHRQEPGPGLQSPHVELHLTVGSKSGGALARAADALARRILDLVAEGVQVVDGGAPRPLDFGDFAILCRASTSFSDYEDALERAGVPFLTVAGRGFFGRPEIRDLLNGLQALSDPTDDLALAGLLRSPAFALSDAALYGLCCEPDPDGSAQSLWDKLRQTGGHLPGDDGPKAERAVRVIAELHDQVGRTSIADLIKAFLDTTDYRAALIQAGDTRAARNVSKLLADAHASGIVGVAEFLDYISGLRDTGAREGEAHATAEGAVQIMTVHAAKGLEFPVVVIGDATRSGGGGGSLLLDRELGILLAHKDDAGALPALYRLAQARDDDQNQAESDRLLYVAATRAREKLIISACIGLQKDGAVRPPGGWLGQIAGAADVGLVGLALHYDETGAQALRLELRVNDTPLVCTIYEPLRTWGARPAAAQAPGPPVSLPLTLLRPVDPEIERVDQRTAAQDRIPPQRVWQVVPTVRRPHAPAWVVGSLVHEALAAWRFPDTDPAQGYARWAEARARGYGITDRRQLRDAVRRVQRLLNRFKAHTLHQEMDRAEQRLHEVPYCLAQNGGAECGIIDTLYLRDGRWTIVEFKTDYVKDAIEFERLLSEEDYLTQAQRYVAAVRTLLGQSPQLILCMLNYAGRVYAYRVEG